MICPDCETKITSKHYDAEAEWYECPKCEGIFTPDELVEANTSEHAKPIPSVTETIREATLNSKPKAKGKKRQEEISADEEAAAEFEAKMLKPVKVQSETKHRDELPVGQVISIMADELEEIYRELGGTLDTPNARDKALTLWRELHYKDGVHAREKAVDHALCGVHS